MVQVCAHLWAMQQLLFWRAFPCSQDAQLLVHKHMPRAGFLYEYGRPAGAARARVNRDSRNELKELHATQKVVIAAQPQSFVPFVIARQHGRRLLAALGGGCGRRPRFNDVRMQRCTFTAVGTSSS